MIAKKFFIPPNYQNNFKIINYITGRNKKLRDQVWISPCALDRQMRFLQECGIFLYFWVEILPSLEFITCE